MKVEELARRFCLAGEERHRLWAKSRGSVPCAQHIAQAQRYWGLVASDDGRRDLAILVAFVEDAR